METFRMGDDLPVEKVRLKQPLHVVLIPRTTWEDNVRSRFTKSRWDALRKAQYQRANYQCEICGESGLNQGYAYPVECHEVWEFDDQQHIQKLVRLIALCPGCHQVQHAGREAAVKGSSGLEKVIRRLRKVNGWTAKEAQRHLQKAFDVWQSRSKHKWELDLTALQSSAVVPGVGESGGSPQDA